MPSGFRAILVLNALGCPNLVYGGYLLENGVYQAAKPGLWSREDQAVYMVLDSLSSYAIAIP